MTSKKLLVDLELEKLQQQSFDYFLHEANPDNGLVIDKTAPDLPASIAATGLVLAAYPVGLERGFMSRHTWALLAPGPFRQSPASRLSHG